MQEGNELAAVFCFSTMRRILNRAVEVAEEVADSIPNATFFALEPEDLASGYLLTPLHLAPTPDAMAAGLFSPELLGAHIDYTWTNNKTTAGGRWPGTAKAKPQCSRWRGAVTLLCRSRRCRRYGAI